jgi:hypothetical protein
MRDGSAAPTMDVYVRAVRRLRQRFALELEGSVDWAGDLDEMRCGRTFDDEVIAIDAGALVLENEPSDGSGA